MLTDDHTLLLTKLHRPRLPRGLLQRTRLIDLLNQHIDSQFVLVCAPAGFGKTTLVSAWLDQAVDSRPAAWLALDELDSDPNLFLRYVVAAMRTIFSNSLSQTLALLQGRQSAPDALLHATFSNELELLPQEFVLVLDDYHTIQSQEVHALLGELVRHWPKPLNLVLVSRLSPPIPLGSLRAKGRLGEIRARDLRFTLEETATFMHWSRTAPLDENELSLLDERFEGWPAGLHLAVLSLRSQGAQESIRSAIAGNSANITEYLVEEVLTHQFPAVHTFLLKSCILDRFCVSLCEAVLGELDPAWNARACLDWIERSELFISPLDDRREWYRYHHLFQELLQQRLAAEASPDQVNELHLRASAWHEQQGFLNEAMQHALAAGDINLAARQLYAGLRDALNSEDRPTLERSLRLLPEEIIQQRPELLMIRAFSLQFQWRLDLQAQVLQQVEALLDSGAGASLPADELDMLRGLILLIKEQYAYFSIETARAIELGKQVLERFPPSWTYVRGGAMLYLTLSMQAAGQAAEAEQLLLDEYQSYSAKDDLYSLFLLQSLCFYHLISGHLEQTLRVAEVLIQGSARTGVALMKHWGHWFLGLVHYYRNNLSAAAHHFTQIVENRYVAHLSPYRDAVAGLALIHQSRGDSPAAGQLVESLSQFDLQQSGFEDSRTRSLRARLKLLQGELDGAGRWADSFTGPPLDQVLMWLEEPQVTRARVLLARDAGGESGGADLGPALQLLNALNQLADRTHTTRHKVELLALRAVALDAMGDSEQAEGELEQALQLARPGGFVRAFVDLGQRMSAVLSRLEAQGRNVEATRRMLAEFHSGDVATGEGLKTADATPHPALVSEPLVEPLTRRELEVLAFLQLPLSIQEVALKLNVSYATAKRHTINIYGKLGVNGRWAAVARAEELNILPPR